ncbi:MAG: hypothetical protein JXN60_02555 [Lentisphaerae bacterium]|nr:hypothetical protein [Lentisphaerota bacterium]
MKFAISNQCRNAAASAVISIVVAMLPLAVLPVKADGGFSYASGGYAFGAANSDTWTSVTSEYADYTSHTFAAAETFAAGGGKLLEGSAIAGNHTVYEGLGKSEYEQTKSARTKVVAKGNNIQAKARSQSHTVIYVDGKAYVVVDELAKAMSRFTPLGTHAAATSDTQIYAAGNGYIGVNTGTKSEANVRVQN